MSEAARSPLTAFHPLKERLATAADGLAIAAAVALPWSVSAASIAIALWLVVLVPTLDWPSLRRCYSIPAGALPALLALLALAGMTWSTAPLSDQLGSLKIPARLIVIGLLLVQFQRSERGLWVVGGFAASCALLLVVSWLVWLIPAFALPGKTPGVPIKDYIIQSGEFLICGFAFAHLAIDAWRDGRHGLALALAALALGFLANIIYVASGRSTLVAVAVLVPLLIWQRFRWTTAISLVVLAGVLGALSWASSHYMRVRVLGIANEISDYRSAGLPTSSGYRLEFWTRSIGIVADAPIIGHGTGSQREQFSRTASGDTGVAGAVTDNPHNQILLVAIQFGALGTVLLLAMWLAHLQLFRGSGLVAWVGTGLVVQNFVAGLFNTSLLEFTHSWMYMIGVGVLGGTMLRANRSDTERMPR